ncbi:MAG: dihydrolipoamide acetyltransferase family protein [Fimbriimonadaceae bacterium]
MTEVIMPKMGDGMEEGTLVEWLKKEGERVKSGEVIGTIQTDKATLELEAPGSGSLAGILIGPGETVPVGQPIAALLADGEKLPDGWRKNGSAAAPQPTVEAKPEVAEPAESELVAPTKDDGGRIKASPLARRIAADAGIDLALVTPSGPGGRVVEKDVRAMIAQGVSLGFPVPARSRKDTKVALNNVRRLTARFTAQSKQSVPHFYVSVAVDVEFLTELRNKMKAMGSAPSVNDFVMLAVARSLTEMPEVNATFQDDHILQFGAVNVGMAVAVDEGLLLAVLRDSDLLTLYQTMAASRALVEKAKAGKLTPNELSGQTFAVSNMGMLNVESFTAIITPPAAGILAIGTAEKRAVVDKETGAIVSRNTMNITGSFDHRVVDGVTGAKFVNLVRSKLENPITLL